LRDGEGKQRYMSVLEWKTRESGDRFSEAVISAIEDEYGALDTPDGA
jgi:hypothetical protein